MQDATLPTFGLDSQYCQLLLAFETAENLTDLARALGRDVSVISRQLQKIAQLAPVLEKQHGRWRLSPLGRQINDWTRDAATRQSRILKRQTQLRIVTTREFAARILAPGLASLLESDAQTLVSVQSVEAGVERSLLEGEADLGFDCGRPQDPQIRFRSIRSEPFAILASPDFLKKHKVRTDARGENRAVIATPHLSYRRAPAARLLKLTSEVPRVFADFNDIASAREACRAGLGWAVLPYYAVDREVRLGELKVLPGWKIPPEQFGVWWVRARNSLGPWVERACRWMAEQDLGTQE